MGYELTRMLRASQVLTELGRPEQTVAFDLADICMDTTRRPPRNMNAGARVCEDLSIPVGTLGNILAKMSARGLELRVPIGKDKHGRLVYAARGHALDFLFPELPPRVRKGPLNDGPLTPEPVDNPTEDASKGPLNDGPFEVIGPLNNGALSAKGPRFEPQRSTKSWTPTPVTPKSKEDARRVGDPIADSDQDQDQDPLQEQPLANWQNRPVHQGPDTRADDDQELSLNDADSATAGSYARAGEPNGPANGHRDPADSTTEEPGGAGAPLSEPARPARSDAIRPDWSLTPEQKAARQVAQSRADREAAERAAGARS